MFSDDFDEFRARSYSGGFLCFAAVDARRSASAAAIACLEPTPAECDDVTANDVTRSDVGVSEMSAVQPDLVRERSHSDEMLNRYTDL